MPAKLPWVERRFRFEFPVAKYPDLIERVRGTPARVEEKVQGIPEEVLLRREPGAWSVQENVGHLADVEALWAGRLDDYLGGAKELRAADMTNRRTREAGHNQKPLASLLADFRNTRERFVARLEALAETDFARTAHHPRLDIPMRLVDLLVFIGEHDDFHLARMTELLRKSAV
jgi:uncharacterized damage-inducible protein DinB